MTTLSENILSNLTEGGLLGDYIDRANLAHQLDVSERTLARYENLPNGLPVTCIGGRKYYRRDSVRDWLAHLERRPNPTRRRVA